MEFFKEDNKNEKSINLESRITAGPIIDIIAKALVQREGFVVIRNLFEKIDESNYRSFFKLLLDDGCYYDEIFEIIKKDDSGCLCIDSLNRGLKDSGLYISHFKPIWPPYTTLGSSEKIKVCMYGSGDLYSDKDITVDETGRVKEIAISGVY